MTRGALVALAALLATAPVHAERPLVRVGSKKFTESVILGEVLARTAHDAGAEVEHRRELGGTRVVWNALRRGDLDAYCEYTGTLRQEILAGRAVAPGDSALAADLAGTVMRDGAAPFLAVEPAGEIRHLSLNNLSADLAGVHLDATGQGDVTPAPDGGGPGDDMAALGIPSGRLDLHVTGFLGLLDTLSNGGSLAPERAAGLKTLLAVFARRGEDGSLTSDITLSPEDGLAINGTALR